VSSVLIIGGGISGLSAAYYLGKAGIPATLIEKRPRLGGVIETAHLDGCTLEAGPDSYIAVKPAATELIKEIGLGDRIIGSNDHLRVTYIWRNSRLLPLPDGLMMMVPTRILPLVATELLGWGTKVRMGIEYLRRPKAGPRPDRSVAELIRDHYGREALDYLAEPLLSGVYGGDPARLSATSVLPRFVELEGKYGSLTRGVLTERARASRNGSGARGGGSLFLTLKEGLGELIGRLGELIRANTTVLHVAAEAIERIPGGYRVRAGGQSINAQDLVLACPAYQAAALLGGIAPELAELLDQVEYSSSLTLSLGYKKKEMPGSLKGFGFLVPKRERGRMVACTWVANKFSYRVPDDQVVLRCFFGGAGDAEILDESDESVVEIAKAELTLMMGLRIEPKFHHIARWPRSMAQYTVGHQDRVRQIETRVASTPGLHLAGNAYYGIGIPDCVKTGRDAAQRISGRPG
jgi:protoporphyrinogen/coproporphyrinogen III oxidase